MCYTVIQNIFGFNSRSRKGFGKVRKRTILIGFGYGFHGLNLLFIPWWFKFWYMPRYILKIK